MIPGAEGSLTDQAFLLERISVGDDGCWLWTGYLTSTGYGTFYEEGRQWSAHRESYELFVGPIPSDLVIDHLCRVRRCINPTHLETVTRRENNIRGIGWAGTHANKTHCVNGHEFAGKNLYIHPDGRRVCRRCVADAQLRRQRRIRDNEASAVA